MTNCNRCARKYCTKYLSTIGIGNDCTKAISVEGSFKLIELALTRPKGLNEVLCKFPLIKVSDYIHI